MNNETLWANELMYKAAYDPVCPHTLATHSKPPKCLLHTGPARISFGGDGGTVMFDLAGFTGDLTRDRSKATAPP